MTREQAFKLLQFEVEVARLQSEVAEQCRLNGMGQERELKLMSEVSQLQHELEKTKAALRLTGEGRPSEWAYTQLLNDYKKRCAQFDEANRRTMVQEAEVERLRRVIAKELSENDELGSEYTYVNALREEMARLRGRLRIALAHEYFGCHPAKTDLSKDQYISSEIEFLNKISQQPNTEPS